MLGCYSFPMHVLPHHAGIEQGLEIPTLREALAASYDVVHERGCAVGVPGRPEDEAADPEAALEAAVAAARGADVCVAVLGDRAGLFGNGTSGEGCDAADLHLPGRQEELLERLLDTGTPVVAVLLVGRPYDLSAFADRLAAVVCGFFLGEEGATAVAEVLSGRTNPSGRLPVSFPSAGSAQPSTYLGSPLAHRSEVTSLDPTPLYPFGHGLGYARATWTSVELVSGPTLAHRRRGRGVRRAGQRRGPGRLGGGAGLPPRLRGVGGTPGATTRRCGQGRPGSRHASARHDSGCTPT